MHHHHNHTDKQEDLETEKKTLIKTLNPYLRYFFSAIGAIIFTTIVFFILNPLSFSQFDFRNNSELNSEISREYLVADIIKVNESEQLISLTTKPEFEYLVESPEIEIMVSPADLNLFTPSGEFTISEKDDVIVQITKFEDQTNFTIVDRYRVQPVMILVLLFVFVVVMFSFQRGIRSLLGLIFSFIILTGLIIPGIISGFNPILVSLLGGLLITIVSLYLSHGISVETTLAVVSTGITIFIATLLAAISVQLSGLAGNGNELSLYLQTLNLGDVDLRGLLMAGIIIGTLGVLDDITTSQIATVREISIANKKYSLKELYESTIRVGKTHIASLINTLILAYAGAALPLFIIVSYNSLDPLWVVLNSEIIVEEIARTVVGSISLILAVPISTVIGAWWFAQQDRSKKD